MKSKLFNKSLEFEINVIGYKDKGECIVFFLKADDKVIYAGIVDCYEIQSENAAIILLESENVETLDFVCWTHPHDDHTIGMDKILTGFCDEKTAFWLPQLMSMDIERYSSSAQKTYSNLFSILESRKRIKMKIRDVSDAKTLECFRCSGNFSTNPYVFTIKSFAPDSNLLLQRKARGNLETDNLYSIGLIINVGYFYVVLGGDVENTTFKCIPDLNIDVNERIDYVKIPHHASDSASYLIDKFNELGVQAPTVATTTLYRIHNLPDKDVLKRYVAWGKDTEVYATGNVENPMLDRQQTGIIKTTIDVLNKKAIPIETLLLGNAVCVNGVI